MPKTSPILAFALGLSLLGGGCRSPKRVENSFDPPSLMRLNVIEDTGRVVVACRVSPIPERLPSEDLVELLRAESSILIEIPKTAIDALGLLTGLERASVWGASANVAKMDGRLKEALLSAWDRGDTRPMALLARFPEGAGDLEAKLQAQGVVPRSVAGSVVTLDADSETLLRFLEMPELLSVSLPRTLEPLQGN